MQTMILFWIFAEHIFLFFWWSIFKVIFQSIIYISKPFYDCNEITISYKRIV